MRNLEPERSFRIGWVGSWHFYNYLSATRTHKSWEKKSQGQPICLVQLQTCFFHASYIFHTVVGSVVLGDVNCCQPLNVNSVQQKPQVNEQSQVLNINKTTNVFNYFSLATEL